MIIVIYQVEINKSGTYWRYEGKLHREEDAPAIVSTQGTLAYFKHGNLHRVGSPAIIYSDGIVEYWFNGKLHNENGAAIIDPLGYQAFYLNGKLHNDNGPAVIHFDGTKEYWIHGKLKYQENFSYHSSHDSSYKKHQ